MNTAIILLGQRNTGKDTIYRILEQRIAGLYNAKFANYGKDLLVHKFGIARETLEDKALREQKIVVSGYRTEISLLSILNSMFHYAKINPKISDDAIQYCLSQIPLNAIPVFTDIRRLKEYSEIYKKYERLFVVRLYKRGLQELKEDEEIDLISNFAKSDSNYEKIKFRLQVILEGDTPLETTMYTDSWLRRNGAFMVPNQYAQKRHP